MSLAGSKKLLFSDPVFKILKGHLYDPLRMPTLTHGSPLNQLKAVHSLM